MKELKRCKEIAEQMLALSAELFALIDDDESERAALFERAKKTPAGT